MSVAKALNSAAAYWFVTVVVGQWIFIAYLIAHYMIPALRGGLAAWSGNNLATGYVDGDPVGNVVVAAHILLAGIILAAGQLQLVPFIRKKFLQLHRWSGRIFLAGAIIASLSGLYMVWVRGNPQAGLAEHIGTSFGAVLNISFAAVAVKAILDHNIAEHRRWALRLFMTVSGVWFIRVGYGLWFFAHGGLIAPTKVFTIVISYAQYVVPLVLLELYFTAQRRSATVQHAMAALLFFISGLIAIGVYVAAVLMWLPRIQ